MDQEVYDKVLELLAGAPDQNGVEDFARLVAFHYPDQGRELLRAVQALPAPDLVN